MIERGRAIDILRSIGKIDEGAVSRLELQACLKKQELGEALGLEICEQLAKVKPRDSAGCEQTATRAFRFNRPARTVSLFDSCFF